MKVVRYASMCELASLLSEMIPTMEVAAHFTMSMTSPAGENVESHVASIAKTLLLTVTRCRIEAAQLIY